MGSCDKNEVIAKLLPSSSSQMKENEEPFFSKAHVNTGYQSVMIMWLVFIFVAAKGELFDTKSIFAQMYYGLMLLTYFCFYGALVVEKGKWYKLLANTGSIIHAVLMMSGFGYSLWHALAYKQST